MRGGAQAASVIACLLMAGCTLETGDEAISGDSPASSLDVLSAEIYPGSCYSSSGFGEGFCHVLVVFVDNSNNRKDFSTNMFNWDARDDQGAVYAGPRVDGPDGIAATGQGNVTLKFDVEDEGVNLTTVHYKDFRTEYWADIPAYS